ncbi:acyltransferase [Tolumonas osonensis]|uniref:Peptidoglycan/LPS O-acetylase OafA/YrhL n=1 Tax=Tolumonas osonensis TaxID=675874 RepID=A0A841GPA6_9GAMM|nr:acyltransferase [Tolumonas osonensis]MBB6056690.1 peptidoglycan/LPS O-acetylase OafA/YrhL [Tolumonas osonensis]
MIMKQNIRIPYWDNWKALAIIAVVAIHASNHTADFSNGSFNWLFGLAFRQLIDFAVPIFFALAGYFSSNSLEQQTKDFYFRRASRILIPYVIWTIIYILIRTPIIPPSPSEILRGLFFGEGIQVGYFVIVLLQFVFLTPIFNMVTEKQIHFLMTVVISLFGVIFTYTFFATNPDFIWSRFPFNALPFFVWYPFYCFGYIVSRYNVEAEIKKLNSIKLFVVLLFSLGLAFIEALFWAYHNNYGFGVSQLKITSFIASITLFIMIVHFSGKLTCMSNSSMFTWLGKNSYSIYLLHLLFLPRIQFIFNKSEWLYSFQPAFIITTILATIICCAGLILVIKCAMPLKVSKNILG